MGLHESSCMNLNEVPQLVIWETTRACDLGCIHGRLLSSMPQRDCDELTTPESYNLLDQVRSCGNPRMIFSGGDPLKRPDLFELLAYSVKLGLRTNVSACATPLLTIEAIEEFQRVGVARMAIGLDGPDAESHDSLCGTAGTFDRVMAGLRYARRIGLETEVQTTITRHNIELLPRIADLVAQVGGKMWSVSFLVGTGWALQQDDLTADEYERVFEILYGISKTARFEIKTTEAMHYRRYVAQRERGNRDEMSGTSITVWGASEVSDGKGLVFVSHTGEVYPSGFLPISAGNVRRDSLADLYRCSPLFQSLRDSDQQEGKCRACEYLKLCGGSRARAYALTGNYLAADPRCVYQPA